MHWQWLWLVVAAVVAVVIWRWRQMRRQDEALTADLDLVDESSLRVDDESEGIAEEGEDEEVAGGRGAG